MVSYGLERFKHPVIFRKPDKKVFMGNDRFEIYSLSDWDEYVDRLMTFRRIMHTQYSDEVTMAFNAQSGGIIIRKTHDAFINPIKEVMRLYVERTSRFSAMAEHDFQYDPTLCRMCSVFHSAQIKLLSGLQKINLHNNSSNKYYESTSPVISSPV